LAFALPSIALVAVKKMQDEFLESVLQSPESNMENAELTEEPAVAVFDSDFEFCRREPK
jgi:hypothetical protein